MIQIIQLILIALAPLAAFLPFSPSPNPNQSPPFTLSVISDNKYLNGSYITGCHAGAGRTALCASVKCRARYMNISPTNFYFNVSAPHVSNEPSGFLIYNSVYNTDKVISQSATMEFNRYSHDFSHPLFTSPDDTKDIFAFRHDQLHLKDHREQRWYICDKYSPAYPYNYPTLVWYHGVRSPHVECVKVEIKRTFV
ncbi:hypothetical protein EAE96_003304 [Botrytis aclada]|nr:hypothetical protein EAE96_003304 [Botrytis aclada]